MYFIQSPETCFSLIQGCPLMKKKKKRNLKRFIALDFMMVYIKLHDLHKHIIITDIRLERIIKLVSIQTRTGNNAPKCRNTFGKTS